ncbi:MAG: HAMP domain-containing sensor histidine kinase [Acidobacteriota bacterium]
MTRRSIASTLALVVVLGLLLFSLATLQWDWLRSIENYEHIRLNSVFSRSSWYFKTAFDREIETLAQCLRAPGGTPHQLADQVGRRLETWQQTSRWPELFQELYLIRADGSGGVSFAIYDPLSREFEGSEEQPDLELLGRTVAGLLAADPAPPSARRGLAMRLLATLPAVLIETRLWSDDREGESEAAWLAVHIDGKVLWEQFVPELTEIFFPAPNHIGTELAIVESASGDLVYSTVPVDSIEAFGRSDAALGLVDVGTDGEELPRVGLRPRKGNEAYPNADRPNTEADHLWFRNLWARISYSGYWHFYVRRGGIPVAEEVQSERWRASLASFGLLGLISTAIVIVGLLARRSQQLAQQQMSFIAGVTHELRTPLAVLSAAGDNLADSLVNDKKQLEEYGHVIQDETLRLQEMVENVLQLARHSTGPSLALRPLDVNEVVERALSRLSRQIRKAGFEVEVDRSDGIRILGNAQALQSAIINLVSNALKYGRPANWLRVTVTVCDEKGQEEVRIAVEDRGPGIEPEDLQRLFEPFFRGRQSREDQIEGSGLGLALVRDVAEAHRGRVSLETGAGSGSIFSLHLPKPGKEPSRAR